MRTPLITITILCTFIFNTHASDLSLATLITNAKKADKVTEGFLRSSTSTDGLRVEPQIGVGENTLTPSITFATNKKFFGDKGQFHFGLKASATASVDVAAEIANNFILEGGDINFALGIEYSPISDLGLSASYVYTLVSTNELSTDKTTLDVESEVSTLRLTAMYAFNDVLLKYSYNRYKASSNGSDSQFNAILDGKSSSTFGVTLPFVQDDKEFFLKFERAKLSGAQEAIFRVAIEADF